MKWVIAIIVLMLLILAATKLYEEGYNTAMAGLIFFIILPYVGVLVANAYEASND